MRTTIQISEELRKKMKVLASYRDISYEEVLKDFIEIFQSIIPFQNEWEFAGWFEKNFDKFGFKRIVEKKKGFPDYKLEDDTGKITKVELEIVGEDFVRHKHDPKKVDMIVCVYSDKDEIEGVPVFSIVESPKNLGDIIGRKQRMSISIDSELVKKINAELSGRTRSISGFVESLLREYFESLPTCVILAGGPSERLFLNELKTYRPLVDVGGRKLIEDNVLKCKNAGFRNFVIVGSSTVISKLYEVLGNGEKYGTKITYLEEERCFGSAKTLELAKKYLKTDFLFLPCDHWFDFDLRKLKQFHFEQNGVVTLAIHAGTSFDWKTSVVEMDGHKVMNYEEYPKKPKTHLISVFIGFMKKEIFKYIPPGDVTWSLQENVFPKIAKEGKLVGYPEAGNWINVHTKQDVEKIIKMEVVKKRKGM